MNCNGRRTKVKRELRRAQTIVGCTSLTVPGGKRPRVLPYSKTPAGEGGGLAFRCAQMGYVSAYGIHSKVKEGVFARMRKWGNMSFRRIASARSCVERFLWLQLRPALIRSVRPGEDCFPCRGGCGFGGTVLPAYHFMLRIAAELSALAAGACRPEGLCIGVRVRCAGSGV